MTTRYMVGTNIDGKSTSVTVMAEDALIAALKVKQKNPAAAITYVRKHNVRGDRRHPHRDVAKDVETVSHERANWVGPPARPARDGYGWH